MTHQQHQQIITELKEYFEIQELVCPHIFARFKQRAWYFFRPEALATLLFLRKTLFQVPIICNTPERHQRGMRCNRCALVQAHTNAYLTPHLDCAFDLTIDGHTAQQAREKIIAAADQLPVPVRLEANVSWLHIDTRVESDQQVQLFY